MTWTQTTLTVLDGAGATHTITAYTDGTNLSLPHSLLDNTGAIIVPSNAGNQTAMITSLAAISTSVAAPPLPSGGATSALQGAGNTSLTAIANAAQAPLAPPPLIVTGSVITRPANTTAYAFGNLVANNATAGSVTPGTIAAARGVNTPTTALRMRLQKSSNATVNAIFRVHLYNQLPAVTNGDGGAWLSTSSGYVGSFDVTVDKSFSDISEGIGIPTTGSTVAFNPVTGTANLYYLIEARAPYAPISGETFTPIIEVQ